MLFIIHVNVQRRIQDLSVTGGGFMRCYWQARERESTRRSGGFYLKWGYLPLYSESTVYLGILWQGCDAPIKNQSFCKKQKTNAFLVSKRNFCYKSSLCLQVRITGQLILKISWPIIRIYPKINSHLAMRIRLFPALSVCVWVRVFVCACVQAHEHVCVMSICT